MALKQDAAELIQPGNAVSGQQVLCGHPGQRFSVLLGADSKRPCPKSSSASAQVASAALGGVPWSWA